MRAEQNIQGHAFNALTYALRREWFLPLSVRERVAVAVVAEVEPLLVKRALAAAYREIAEWADPSESDALLKMAAGAEALSEDDICCPVCA